MSFGRVFAFKEQMRLTIRINFVNIQPAGNVESIGNDPNRPNYQECDHWIADGRIRLRQLRWGSTFVPPRQGTPEMRFSF